MRSSPLVTPDLALAEVRPLEPPLERDTGREAHDEQESEERVGLAAAAGAMAAVAPQPHSFGRR